ncbi:hypothetical protein [Streptomyces sp. NPDC015242]|uniref:hypothetical protein n=1 Tax=Streptomyces sp. NPDC015242 TaxID=3364951 RepID=UPI003700F7D0
MDAGAGHQRQPGHRPTRSVCCPAPFRCEPFPSPLFSAGEYRRAPLVILDDRSYNAFALRRMPHRPGLILALADPGDDTAQPRAAAIGAEGVLRAGQGLAWLHLRLRLRLRLRLHEATGCRYVRWEDALP